MFIFYGLIYAGFVCINILKPTLMEMTVVFGLNFATCYGFFLIIFALILALIYSHICTKKEIELAALETESESK